jgi:hypothetical protein
MAAKSRLPLRPRRAAPRVARNTHRLVLILPEARQRLGAAGRLLAVRLQAFRHGRRRKRRPGSAAAARCSSSLRLAAAANAARSGAARGCEARHPAQPVALAVRALRAQCCWRSSAGCAEEREQTARARLLAPPPPQERQTPRQTQRGVLPRLPWRRAFRSSSPRRRRAPGSTPGAGAWLLLCELWRATHADAACDPQPAPAGA